MEGSSSSHKRKKLLDEPMKKNKKRHDGNIMEEKRSGCVKESFGVFEFPWLKESMISTSLDWSLPGSLFPVIDDRDVIVEEEVGEVRCPVLKRVISNDRFDQFEAFECIWSYIESRTDQDFR